MKCGALVMTFHRPTALGRTLELHLGQSRSPDVLLIVDNGGSPETARVVRGFDDPRLVHRVMDENVGPAGAGAFGLDWLLRRGCDYLYWGNDDDPPPTPTTFEELLDLATGSEAPAGVGVVGSLWDWRRGEQRRLLDEQLDGTLDVDVIGGNQQLWLRREAVEAVGLPDPRLFFGLEEVEYCLRLRRNGFRLIVDGATMREQRRRAGRLGIDARPRSVRPSHSPGSLWRRYYSTRNYIFIMRRLYGRPDLARREALKSAARCVAASARGPRYARSFAQLQLSAVRDGYRGRLGRTVAPPMVDGHYPPGGDADATG